MLDVKIYRLEYLKKLLKYITTINFIIYYYNNLSLY
jgi:hypothetical protein